MIKNNKLKTLISSIVILLPSLFGVIMWDKIPDVIVTHMGLDGTPDSMGSKAILVFGLPAILLVAHLFCLWISGKDPGHKKQSKKALGIIFWILPVASICINGLMYAVTFEVQFNPMILLIFFLGFMFIGIGNYLPVCKQNATLGIKIKWTLENEENWRATHRFSGKVWFVCGVLILPCAFLPEKFVPAVLMGILIPVVVLPVAYSYLYYKKQVKEGTYSKDKSVIKELPKSYKIVTVIALAALAIILPFIMFSGDINFNVTETELEIDADFYNDISISLDSINDIEFRETTVDGLRTGGFGSAKLLMGKFKNEEFGFYTRYTYTDDTGCVIITVGEDKLVIAGKTLTETKVIYDSLTEKVK